MKTLWKIICLTARLAAVFAVLSLLAQWLSRGHEGRRYLYSREMTNNRKSATSRQGVRPAVFASHGILPPCPRIHIAKTQK